MLSVFEKTKLGKRKHVKKSLVYTAASNFNSVPLNYFLILFDSPPLLLLSLSLSGYVQWFLTAVPHLIRALILGIMALLFEFSNLVDLMSIGHLLVYSLVALFVLVLR